MTNVTLKRCNIHSYNNRSRGGRSKGSVFDLIPFLIIISILAITIILAQTIYDEIEEENNEGGYFNATTFKSAENALNIFDAGFILIVIGLILHFILSKFSKK